MPQYRNLYANHPLMRKGGVHIESKTGQRSRHRHRLQDEAAEALEAYYELQEKASEGLVVENEEELEAAPFYLAAYFMSLCGGIAGNISDLYFRAV